MDITNTTNQSAEMLQEPPQFIQFPTIPLCKDISDKSVYSTIYCYILLILYFSVIVTFLIWQIRWVYLWWKRQKDNGFTGLGSNHENIEFQQNNKKIFSGLLSKRSSPVEK